MLHFVLFGHVLFGKAPVLSVAPRFGVLPVEFTMAPGYTLP